MQFGSFKSDENIENTIENFRNSGTADLIYKLYC